MCTHVQWAVMQNRSSFLIKRNKQTQSTEGSQLLPFKGPIHLKTLGVEPVAEDRGVVVVVKHRSVQ